MIAIIQLIRIRLESDNIAIFLIWSHFQKVLLLMNSTEPAALVDYLVETQSPTPESLSTQVRCNGVQVQDGPDDVLH